MRGRAVTACRPYAGHADGRAATRSLWHPFADMAAVRGNELVISRGEGVWLWDEDGNRYLDGSASLWYCQRRSWPRARSPTPSRRR